MVHLASRIKMGVAGLGDAPAACPSSRKPEDQQERLVKFFRCFGVDTPDDPPNAVAAERDKFVCHDLRPQPKAVLRSGFDQRPEQEPVPQVR